MVKAFCQREYDHDGTHLRVDALLEMLLCGINLSLPGQTLPGRPLQAAQYGLLVIHLTRNPRRKKRAHAASFAWENKHGRGLVEI